MGSESVLNDGRGPDWYFSQENEWALAAVLNNITKVQGQFRGVLLRKKTSKHLGKALSTQSLSA